MPKLKRANGEGSTYRRKDGRWCATCPGGRPSFYGRTRDDAMKKRDAYLRRFPSGRAPRSSSQSFEDFVKLAWLPAKATTLRPGTLRKYTDFMESHILPHIGKLSLARITPADIQRMMDAAATAKLSPATVADVRAIASRALETAVQWELIHTNPARNIKPPRLAKSAGDPITLTEALAVIETCRTYAGGRYAAPVLMMVALGLRRGEVLGIAWEDTDLTAGTVLIRQQLDADLNLVPVKTEKSRRMLKLPAAIVTALKEHKARQAEWKLANRLIWTETGLVFSTALGTPISPRNLVRTVQIIFEKAKVRRRRVHDLRHTAATLLLADGAPIQHVSDMLGHSSIAITKDIYGHVVPATMTELADRLDRLVKG